jgi:PAS domain S-box-containing protein
MVKTTVFRWQGAMVLLGMVLGVTANFLDLSGYGPSPHLKLTPIGVAIAIPLFIISLFRVRRADLVPVARSSVIELMKDPVMVLDVENRLIDANPATLALVGRGLNSTMGRFIKDELPELASQIEQLLSNDEQSYEIKLKRNGELRTYDVLISALNDWRGQKTGRVLVLRDVTDRARAEEALRLSEESYRLHFANVSDVVFSYNKNLVILSITPSIEQYLGFSPAECLGKSILELGILAPEYLEEAAANILRVIGGERIEGAVYECIARDGTRLMAEISASPIIVGNEVVEVVNVARDITARVRAEKALKASVEEKELLLKEVHHRVKNNMQIISSLLSLQSRAVESPMLRAQLDDSQNRIRTMALVHERLYRSEDLSSIELSSYLRDLMSNLLQTHLEQCEPVSFSFGMEPLSVDIDTAIPCGLIVNELITNSLKHAFKGEKERHLSLEGCRDEGGIYQIAVRDNGVGISPQNMPPNIRTLGLKLITSLTKQLKGTFSLQSQDGTSAVLSFAIDRTAAAAAYPLSLAHNDLGTKNPESKQVMEG